MSETAGSVREAIDTGIVLVAELDGVIVGSVRGNLREDGIVEVGRLVVAPELQNRGIGRHLACELEAHYPDATGFEIFTGHKSAGSIALYESLGYRREREVPIYDGLTLIYLHKDVP